MTFRAHLRSEPALLNFIKYRRLIKHVFKSRQQLVTERNSYRRITSKLVAEENVFNRNRINKFEMMQAECLLDINELEDHLDTIITSAYECMGKLSTLLEPQEKAWLVGATTQWLKQRNEHWVSLGLFQLYFNLMAESEKTNDLNGRPMFWFCGLMVAKNSSIHELFLNEEDEPQAPVKVPHLSLVR
jgi:hypothetical protein